MIINVLYIQYLLFIVTMDFMYYNHKINVKIDVTFFQYLSVFNRIYSSLQWLNTDNCIIEGEGNRYFSRKLEMEVVMICRNRFLFVQSIPF